MKETNKSKGIIRGFDSIGRFTIPKTFRDILNIQDHNLIEITCENGFIKIKKYEEVCNICGTNKNLIKIKNTYICDECKKEIKALE
ncbi:AbrB family transcriptional regulator [Paraclostridium sordellii 8483]|uniref:AbrB/MazE/SpoVT family DNA-binding domain-containing protein n=1 Tax=Paraclostridium sordellii TaxID=1505 RepID=UPI0002EEECBD|nr:AbrB/MazE/SpoVT family DNA-binding domain-containing protein [Paeniclostridium sordellii]TAN66633.1 AbrB family transcriptional regulator [Paeniclostridium sordellii 8483]